PGGGRGLAGRRGGAGGPARQLLGRPARRVGPTAPHRPLAARPAPTARCGEQKRPADARRSSFLRPPSGPDAADACVGPTLLHAGLGLGPQFFLLVRLRPGPGLHLLLSVKGFKPARRARAPAASWWP